MLCIHLIFEMAKHGNNGRKGRKDKRTWATVSRNHKRNKHRPPTKAKKAILKIKTPSACERTNEGYEQGHGGSHTSDWPNEESTTKFKEGHGMSCASNKVKTRTSKFVEGTTITRTIPRRMGQAKARRSQTRIKCQARQNIPSTSLAETRRRASIFPKDLGLVSTLRRVTRPSTPKTKVEGRQWRYYTMPM